VVPRVLPAPRDRDGTGSTTSGRSAEPVDAAAGPAGPAETAAASALPRPVGHADVAPVAVALGAPAPKFRRRAGRGWEARGARPPSGRGLNGRPLGGDGTPTGGGGASRGERRGRTGGGGDASRAEESRRFGGGGGVATAARRRPEDRVARGGDEASLDARGAAAGSVAAAATAAAKLPGKKTKLIEEKDIKHKETRRKGKH